MKITKRQLKEIIREEVEIAMDEGFLDMFKGKKEPPPEPVDCKGVLEYLKFHAAEGKGRHFDWSDKRDGDRNQMALNRYLTDEKHKKCFAEGEGKALSDKHYRHMYESQNKGNK